MEALNPARLPLDRYPEALSLQDLEPVRPLRICLLGYRSHPYGGGQGVYLRYLSKASPLRSARAVRPTRCT